MINLLMSYFLNTYSVFVSLLSIDSVYCLVDFIKQNSDETLTDTEVLNTYSELYKVGTVERYIYYGLMQSIFTFGSTFLFNMDMPVTKYMMGLTLVPIIFNNIIYKYSSKYFDYITTEKNELIKKICFEQIANIVINLEKIYLDSANNGINIIPKTEIIKALNHIQDIKSQFGTLLQNIIITFLMVYLRNVSTVGYKLAKHIYIFKSKDYIERVDNIEKAKEIFKDVIYNKKYDQLTKPMFIQSMLVLYYSKEDSGSFWTMFNKFKYRTIIMLTIWPIGSLFQGYISIVSIIISALSITLTRKLPMSESVLFNFKYLDDRSIVSLGLATVIGLITKNTLLTSFLSQFGGPLSLNKITFSASKIIYKKITSHQIMTVLCDTHYNYMTNLKYVLVAMSFIYFTSISNYFAYMMPIITNFINTPYFKYMYIILYVGMMNNRNNILIIIIFAYVMSMIENIIYANQYRKTHRLIQSKNVSNTNNTNANIIDITDTIDEDYFAYIEEPPKPKITTDFLHPTIEMAKNRTKTPSPDMYGSFFIVKEKNIK